MEEEIDVAHVGPLDLSVSSGVPQKWSSSVRKNAIQKVLDEPKEDNVMPGIHSRDLEDVKERIYQGFQFISFSSDTAFLLSAGKAACERVIGLL